MSPAGLLPTDRGYWTYEGSLTAPPCTEGVRWLIFEQQVEISRDQLKAFATSTKSTAARFRTPTAAKSKPASKTLS